MDRRTFVWFLGTNITDHTLWNRYHLTVDDPRHDKKRFWTDTASDRKYNQIRKLLLFSISNMRSLNCNQQHL